MTLKLVWVQQDGKFTLYLFKSMLQPKQDILGYNSENGNFIQDVKSKIFLSHQLTLDNISIISSTRLATEKIVNITGYIDSNSKLILF